MQVRARDLLLVPNILSLARIALVFVPAYLISLQKPEYKIYVLVTIFLGIATDILDGYLARKLGQVSDLGKILDPAADKLCTVILVIALHLYSDFPLWAVVLLLSRDFIALIVAVSFTRRTKILTTSNIIGRLAALSWGVVILVYVIDWELLEFPLLLFATAMVLASAVSYTLMLLNLQESMQDT